MTSARARRGGAVRSCLQQNEDIRTTAEFVNKYAVKIVVLQLFDFQIMKLSLGNIDEKYKSMLTCHKNPNPYPREANIPMFVNFVPLEQLFNSDG